MTMRLASLFAVVCSSAWATTIPQLPVEQLFEDAETVAIVTVTDGHMLDQGNCGATYRARVEHLFKGARVESLEFGPFTGAAIGREYLVFLTAPHDDYSPITSTTSTLGALERDHRQRCIKYQVTKRIMHSGEGMMEIRNWRVHFQARNVKFPDSLNPIRATFGECTAETEMSSIRKADVVQFLAGLGQANETVGAERH